MSRCQSVITILLGEAGFFLLSRLIHRFTRGQVFYRKRQGAEGLGKGHSIRG